MSLSTDTLERDVTEFNAGNALSVKQKEQRAKIRLQRRTEGLGEIMRSVNGRAWMWDNLSSCGIFRTDFNGNSRDYYNLGMRNAAMVTFNEINQFFLPEYQLMQKENGV
jgi:hypothetical protein